MPLRRATWSGKAAPNVVRKSGSELTRRSIRVRVLPLTFRFGSVLLRYVHGLTP